MCTQKVPAAVVVAAAAVLGAAASDPVRHPLLRAMDGEKLTDAEKAEAAVELKTVTETLGDPDPAVIAALERQGIPAEVAVAAADEAVAGDDGPLAALLDDENFTAAGGSTLAFV